MNFFSPIPFPTPISPLPPPSIVAANPTHIQRSYKIDKLTNQNFHTWAVKVEMLIARSELWGYVDGIIANPGTAHPDYPAWKAANTKAKSDIILHLEKLPDATSPLLMKFGRNSVRPTTNMQMASQVDPQEIDAHATQRKAVSA